MQLSMAKYVSSAIKHPVKCWIWFPSSGFIGSTTFFPTFYFSHARNAEEFASDFDPLRGETETRAHCNLSSKESTGIVSPALSSSSPFPTNSRGRTNCRNGLSAHCGRFRGQHRKTNGDESKGNKDMHTLPWAHSRKMKTAPNGPRS